MFFVRTLQIAAGDLLSFVSLFSVVFGASLTLFYLLFVSTLQDCASLPQTAQMLFDMMLMKFDAHHLSAASPFLGPITFSLFMLERFRRSIGKVALCETNKHRPVLARNGTNGSVEPTREVRSTNAIEISHSGAEFFRENRSTACRTRSSQVPSHHRSSL